MTTSLPPNHAEKAREILTAARKDNDQAMAGLDDIRLELEFAQVHATLALVDEQRTANLIARWEALGNPPPGIRPTTEQWERIIRLDDLITARLDLTQDVTP